MLLKSLRSIFLPATALCFAACSVPTQGTSEAPASSDEALFSPSGVQFFTANSNNVPVCFATPGNAREKDIIKASVLSTWGTVANVHITFADPCPSTSDQYVQIWIGEHTQVPDGHGGMYWDHSTDGQTRGMGMATLTPANVAATSTSPGMKVWVEPNGTSAQPRMEYVAVHEFGHVLGFDHEQYRPEQEARACDPNTGDIESGTTIGPYDRASIMNYCNDDGNGHGYLSEGDIAGVRQIYGFPIAIGTFFADLDGDKKADAIAVDSNGIYTNLSNGSSFNTFGQWSGGAFYGSRDTLFADLDGDGKADAIAINRSGVWVMKSTGHSFTFSGQWSGAFYGDRKTLAGDVNGDGKADLIAVNLSGVWVMLSTGTGFAAPTQWSGPFYGNHFTFAADVNGDGKTDLLALNGEGIWVALSNGSNAFNNVGAWAGRFYGYHGTAVGDIDGDGKADVAAFNDDAIYVLNSDGTKLNWGGAQSPGPFYGQRNRFIDGSQLADVTGDGKADAIAVNNSGLWATLSSGRSFGGSGKWSGPFYGQ